MSKFGDVHRAQEALRALMTAEPVNGGDVEIVAAVLFACGRTVITNEYFDALKSASDELDLLKAGEAPAPSPWPFNINDVVYADGNGVEMIVTGFKFDGSLKVCCDYWDGGTIMSIEIDAARLRAPT